MLLFGHVGITLGAAVFLSGVLASNHSSKTVKNRAMESSSSLSTNVRTSNNFLTHKLPRFTSLGNRIDIRFLLIGSLLPDIIDKLIGQVLFRETFGNGRIFSHTLLFIILVTVIGLLFYRYNRKTWLLVLSFGTFIHLILDEMWRAPRTLLWPILGLSFESIDITGWAANIWHALFTEPAVYVPELIGVLILIWFTWMLIYTRKTYVFVRYGRIQ